jgi:ketosteroid isomerase-like protein
MQQSGENLKTANDKSEREIKVFMDGLAEAVRTGELEDISSYYADEIVAFDMMPPLQFKTKEDYQRVAWKECFTDYFTFPVDYDFHQQEISVSGDLAVVHGLVHMKGKSKKEGADMEAWLRSTVVLKKAGDRWAINHEHTSVPLAMEDAKGLMNLAPDKELQ